MSKIIAARTFIFRYYTKPYQLMDGIRAAVVLSPGQHEVGVGVAGPGAGGAPLDGVDFFAVGLEVVDARVLLHTPDLRPQRRRSRSWRLVSVSASAQRV